MAMATSYNCLFQWDYTFYKWVMLVLSLINGHNCTGLKKKQVIEIIHDHPATLRRHSFALSTWPVVKIQFMAAY